LNEGKAKNLQWFNEIMKIKMLRHDTDPMEMTYSELLAWLQKEVAELKESLQFESRDKNILECGDVANLAYFIASKIKMGV
jgi:hypothetical protein